MFNMLFLLQGTAPAAQPFDFSSITTSAGWQVGILFLVFSTLGLVIRQRSTVNLNQANANIDQQKRDDEFREAQEKATNEIRQRHEKLMDETRLQFLTERNQALARALELQDSFQKLSVQFIESQQSTIKLQGQLAESQRAEQIAVRKAEELSETVRALRGDVGNLQIQLTAATLRIDELSKENQKLQLRVQRISTGSIPKIEVSPTEVNPT